MHSHDQVVPGSTIEQIEKLRRVSPAAAAHGDRTDLIEGRTGRRARGHHQ